jgi:hypothetical protein
MGKIKTSDAKINILNSEVNERALKREIIGLKDNWKVFHDETSEIL